MHRVVLAAGLTFAFLTSTPALAQDADASLLRLKSNRWIRVETRDAIRIDGTFLRASGDSLTLRPDTALVTVATLAIASVHERRGSAGAGAVVGALLGATAGAIGGAAWARGDSFLKPDSESEGAVAVGIAGALVGAGLGAIVGSFVPHWRLRYRAAP